MGQPLNIKPGDVFGKLTVVSEIGWDENRNRWFLCRCSCDGREHKTKGTKLKCGRVKSCGCLRHGREGLTTNPLYNTWVMMIRRCYDPKTKGYPLYGGRGITVCDRWRKEMKTFVSDMGPKPSPLHSIDRIDNNKGYSPENCRWASRAEQNINRRQHVIKASELQELRDKLAAYETLFGPLPENISASV